MQVITYVGWKLLLWIFGAGQKIMALFMCKVQRDQIYYRRAGSLPKCFHFVFKNSAAPLIQGEVQISVAVTWLSFSWAVSILFSTGSEERTLLFTGTDQSFILAECLAIYCRKTELASFLPLLPLILLHLVLSMSHFLPFSVSTFASVKRGYTLMLSLCGSRM